MASIVQYNPSDPTVANRVTLYLISRNTPDYEGLPNTLINPDLSAVSGVSLIYWKYDTGDVVEMTQAEKDAVDAEIAQEEDDTIKSIIAKSQVPVDDAAYVSTEIVNYSVGSPSWTDSVTGIKGPPALMQALCNRRELFNDVENPLYDASVTPILGAGGWLVDHANRINNLETIHGKLGWHQQEIVRGTWQKPKDLLIFYGWPGSFNSAVNAWDREKVSQDMSKYGLIVFGTGLETIYDSGTHTGGDGEASLTDSTKDWVNNSLTNKSIINLTDGSVSVITSNNKTVVNLQGLGGGSANVWNTGDSYLIGDHTDFANAWWIAKRIKTIKPDAVVFGYVTVNQDLTSFETKAGYWDTLGYGGIFMDEAGYDYGKTRSEFNDRVDYVHALTNANICFANAWNIDHVLGTENDPSYPNTTYNSGLVESNLTANDWYLLESFAVNTTAYSGDSGYEAKANWAARGVKAVGKRATYGINLAGSGVIDNGNSSGDDLFSFFFTSALMFSLDGSGTSDTSYASGSSAVDWWVRPDVSKMGRVYNLNPTVQVDYNDADVYWRYLDFASLKLDFSAGAQASAITKW